MCEVVQKKKNIWKGTYGELLYKGVFSQRLCEVVAKANRSWCRWCCRVWTPQRSGEHINGGVQKKKTNIAESLGNITLARSFLAAPKAASSYWTGGKRWAQRNEATLAHYAPADTLIGHSAYILTEKTVYMPCVTLGF